MRKPIFARLQAVLAAAILASIAAVNVPVLAQEATEEAPAETVEATLDADTELLKAQTADDPNIPIDQLEFLVQPLTVEELQIEASAWLILLKNKVDQFSETEVAIKRINTTVDAEKAAVKAQKEANDKLAAASEVSKDAKPGSSESEAAIQTVTEAREAVRQANRAMRQVARGKEKLKQSPGFKRAILDAQKRNDLSYAEEVLQYATEIRAKFQPGTGAYEASTQRIDQLALAIIEVGRAEEQLNRTAKGFPQFEAANQRFEEAKTALNEATKIPGAQNIRPKENVLTGFAGISLETSENEADGDGAAPADSISAEDLELNPAQLEAEAKAQNRLKNSMVDSLPWKEKQRNATIDRLNAVLKALEAKGGDITPFQKYIEASTITRLDVTDTEGLGIRAVNWLFDKEGGLGLIINLVTFLVITTLAWFASIFVARFSDRMLTRMGSVSKLFQGFAVNIIKRGVFIAGICLALATIGIDLGPILAVVGGASFILAFALQSNLGNFASGLMLLVNKPFDVGDEVKVGGYWAYVESITLANTKFKDFTGNVVLLPNNTVWGGDIVNYTHTDQRKLALAIEIKFTQSLEIIEKMWKEITSSNPKILDNPSPSVFPWNSTYNYNIWVSLTAWSTTDDYWGAYVELLKALQQGLNEAGIELAAPVQNINLNQMAGNQPPNGHAMDASTVDVQAAPATE